MNRREHAIASVMVGAGLGFMIGGPVTAVATALYSFVGDQIPDFDQYIGTHRKTLHNLWFPVVVLAGGVPVLMGLWEPPAALSAVPYVSAGYLTHLLVDALGSCRGVALLYPFSPKEWQSAGGVTVDDPLAPVASFTVGLLVLGIVTPLLVVIG